MRTPSTGRVIPVRLPLPTQEALDIHLKTTGKSQTEAMREAVALLLSAAPHAKFERIPSHKVKRPLAPLSEHTKARMSVYNWIHEPTTSSDIAHWTGQTTNNVAKRLGELAQEGYIEPTGEYRKSRDSSKRLTVWKRTSKQYLPVAL